VRLLALGALAGFLALSSPAQASDNRAMVPMEGIASYYGWRHHGRRMANGKRFNALGATAASRTLPLGCRIRVTNMENGLSTEVTIEDRGPYIRGRILDLSLGAAQRLGMTKAGLAWVHITILPDRR